MTAEEEVEEEEEDRQTVRVAAMLTLQSADETAAGLDWLGLA